MNWPESSYSHQRPGLLFTAFRLACQRIIILLVLWLFGKPFLIECIFYCILTAKALWNRIKHSFPAKKEDPFQSHFFGMNLLKL